MVSYWRLVWWSWERKEEKGGRKEERRRKRRRSKKSRKVLINKNGYATTDKHSPFYKPNDFKTETAVTAQLPSCCWGAAMAGPTRQTSPTVVGGWYPFIAGVLQWQG